MKRIILLSIFASFFFMGYGQSKADLVKEITAYKKSIVSNATYDKKQSEIFSALVVLANEEYSSITRESESKGYLEAKQEKETYRETFYAEIRGESAPYRVTFNIKKEHRTKNENNYSDWSTFGSVSEAYLLKCQLRVYEQLNGLVELSKELQAKVEKFNEAQTKEKNKLVKGKDY